MTFFLCLVMPQVFAFSGCPESRSNEEWSVDCIEREGGIRHIKDEFIKNLKFDKNGIAVIFIPQLHELAAVSRTGEIVVPNIRHTGDFDYPDVLSKIARYEVEPTKADGASLRQCGYFSTENFKIIVPASFDHCQPFQGSETLACRHCVAYCSSQDCQRQIFVGGTGYYLSRDGRFLRAIALPNLEKVCKSPRAADVSEVDGTTVLRCVEKDMSPLPQRNNQVRR